MFTDVCGTVNKLTGESAVDVGTILHAIAVVGTIMFGDWARFNPNDILHEAALEFVAVTVTSESICCWIGKDRIPVFESRVTPADSLVASKLHESPPAAFELVLCTCILYVYGVVVIEFDNIPGFVNTGV